MGIFDNTVVGEDKYVQFKSPYTKQSIFKCNLTRKAGWIITVNVPDPQDVIWKHITCGTNHTKAKIYCLTFPYFLLVV